MRTDTAGLTPREAALGHLEALAITIIGSGEKWLRVVTEDSRLPVPALHVSVPGVAWLRVIAGAEWFRWEGPDIDSREAIEPLNRPDQAALRIIDRLDRIRQEKAAQGRAR